MNASNRAMNFAGHVSEGLGIALWQADGSGPEPAAVGHTFITPIEPITAHYYVASRDHIDVGSPGGVKATDLVGGWPNFTAALRETGRDVSDVVIQVPLTTAGADQEGEDWFYRDDVETRYLRPQAPLPLLLDGTALIEFGPPRLTLTEDYRGARHFIEVRISLASEPTLARAARAVTERFAAVAQAFLADLGGRPVRFVVDSIQLTGATFGGHGRLAGVLAEIPTARLEIV